MSKKTITEQTEAAFKNHELVTRSLTQKLTAAGVPADLAANVAGSEVPFLSFQRAEGNAITTAEWETIQGRAMSRDDVKRAIAKNTAPALGQAGSGRAPDGRALYELSTNELLLLANQEKPFSS